MTRTSKDALKRPRNARRGKMAHFTVKSTIHPRKPPAEGGKRQKNEQERDKRDEDTGFQRPERAARPV